jgi:hypothetical protein
MSNGEFAKAPHSLNETLLESGDLVTAAGLADRTGRRRCGCARGA